MKKGTGKRRAARKPQIVRQPLPPLDVQQRYSIQEAARYLRQSIPSVYKLINAGRLETFKSGRRRFATGRGIAALSIPQ